MRGQGGDKRRVLRGWRVEDREDGEDVVGEEERMLRRSLIGEDGEEKMEKYGRRGQRRWRG